MKTWEMIKELTENPNKKFTYDSATKGSYVTVVDDVVVWKGAGQGGQTVAICLGCGDAEWEEVKEPVSFMEAIKSLDEGKTVYCEVDNRKFTYKQPRTYITEIRSEEAGCISIKEILEGKWYIEEY